MRVAGTPEARRAWLVLRGPYFCAYVLLAIIAFSVQPITSLGWIWHMGLILCASASAAGSLASWLIAGKGRMSKRLLNVEALEVTGLRVMIGLQFLYAAIVPFLVDVSSSYVLLNLCIGFFALGILLNMTWHKKVAEK